MFQTPFQCLQTDAALWSCVMFLGIRRDLDHKDRAGNVYCCLAASSLCGQLHSRKPGAGGAHSWGQCVPEARWPGRGSGRGLTPICPVDAWTLAPRVCLPGNDSSARCQSPAGREADRYRCSLGRESSSRLGQMPWDLQGP